MDRSMTVDEGLRLVAGLFVLASTALGYWVHPGFLAFTAFVGANLAQSALTGWCPMMCKGSPYPVVTSGTRRAMMHACRDDGQGVAQQRAGRGRAPRCYDATRSRGSVAVPGFAMARRAASAR